MNALEREVLNVLDAVPETRMLGSTAILGSLPAGSDATLTDVERVLKILTSLREVVGIGGRDGTLWKITAVGKARVAL